MHRGEKHSQEDESSGRGVLRRGRGCSPLCALTPGTQPPHPCRTEGGRAGEEHAEKTDRAIEASPAWACAGHAQASVALSILDFSACLKHGHAWKTHHVLTIIGEDQAAPECGKSARDPAVSSKMCRDTAGDGARVICVYLSEINERSKFGVSLGKYCLLGREIGIDTHFWLPIL